MKISLACIAGNAEKYITRFLDSFQPWFDEVIVVRAIGNQDADNTMAIAQSRGCIVGEYTNKRTDWPHVDDFAAARNQAFDMATGDFVMWADMDDLLEGGEHIRTELEAMPESALAMGVLYDVRDDGLIVTRERIIRRGAARWTSPIHECLDFPNGVKAADTTRFRIVHAPIGNRKANDERNLRILESIENPNASQRFHKIMSLQAVGRHQDAIRDGVALLTERPADMGTAELYEVAFMIAQLAQDDDFRAQMMLQALAIDPRRREAYGDLAMSYVARDEGDKAMAMATSMMALDEPNPRPWNTRQKYYGFAAPLIYGAALRSAGRFHHADVMERNHFIRAGAQISLIHATRGRPVQASKARWKWIERAKNPDAVEHIFALDINDETAGLLCVHRHVFCWGNGGPVDGWNTAASQSCGKVLVQLSDDWEPPLHWDQMILEAIGDTSKPAVLAISDGHRKDDLLCMAIMTRARFEDQGYMFHPEFFSMFSDNWFSKQAFADGVVIDARDRITFEHLHPVFGKAEMDETYARSNASHHYKFGAGIMRRLENGVRVSAEIHGWFDFRDVYDAVALNLPECETHVEVGAWMGKSITYLADRIEDLGKNAALVAVDHFKGDCETGMVDVWEDFDANTRGRNISAITGDSAESADLFEDASLFSVFIDGAHDAESATRDIAAWLPKVKPGGIFAGHDADSKGVKAALETLKIPHAIVGRCWVATNPTP